VNEHDDETTQTCDGQPTLGRRELIAGAGALVGMAAASSAFASSHEGHAGHAGHGKGEYTEARAAKAHPEIVAAVDACLRAGRTCFSHCLETFRAGETNMADCAFAVEQMLQVCAATEALASYDSKHLKGLAAVCIDVCNDCEKECRKHEEHQPECKACADACADVVEALRTL